MRPVSGLALLSLLLLLPTASAAWTLVAQGGFPVGSPHTLVWDACTGRTWGIEAENGLDSSCFDIAPLYRNHPYQIRWGENNELVLATSLCFFTDDWSFSLCQESDFGAIPGWAAHASISTATGRNVEWRMYADV